MQRHATTCSRCASSPLSVSMMHHDARCFTNCTSLHIFAAYVSLCYVSRCIPILYVCISSCRAPGPYCSDLFSSLAFVRPLHIWHYVPQALQRSLGHVKDAQELYPFEGRAAWLIQLLKSFIIVHPFSLRHHLLNRFFCNRLQPTLLRCSAVSLLCQGLFKPILVHI